MKRSCSIAKSEIGWVVIDTDLDMRERRWGDAWVRGRALVELGICTEFDVVRDEFRTNPDATVDGLPVHDNPTMRNVLLETLALKTKSNQHIGEQK